MTDESALLAAIDADPTHDAHARLAYADWLDEAGRENESLLQRWLVATQTRAEWAITRVRGHGPAKRWSVIGPDEPSRCAALPPELFARLRNGRLDRSGYWRAYPCSGPSDAYADLLQAFTAARKPFGRLWWRKPGWCPLAHASAFIPDVWQGIIADPVEGHRWAVPHPLEPKANCFPRVVMR